MSHNQLPFDNCKTSFGVNDKQHVIQCTVPENGNTTSYVPEFLNDICGPNNKLKSLHINGGQNGNSVNGSLSFTCENPIKKDHTGVDSMYCGNNNTIQSINIDIQQNQYKFVVDCNKL